MDENAVNYQFESNVKLTNLPVACTDYLVITYSHFL